jgi:hypothetical protein
MSTFEEKTTRSRLRTANWRQQVAVGCLECECDTSITHGVFAAEAAEAEPWQLQCAQLKSEKSVLTSRLHTADAAAAEATAELESLRDNMAASGAEVQRLKAEMQELRHQVSFRQCASHVIGLMTHITGLATAARCS